MGVKVREKPTGSGVWWIFINHNGRRKSKRIGSESAAREAAAKIEAKLVLKEFEIEKHTSKAPTFKDHAKLWLSLPHDWKQSTRESYELNLKNHIYPALGKYPLNEIGRKDLKAFFDGLLSKGKSPATVAGIRAPIKGILSHAVDSELIEVNPILNLTIAMRKKKTLVEPLTEPEAEKLLQAAKKHLGGHYYPHILCALRTGMRLGELKALQWSDIDFDKRQIEVQRSCRRGVISDTKNHKRRRVDITPLLTDTLKELKLTQKKRAIESGRPFSDFVFASRRGNIFIRVPFEYALRKCLEAAKLKRIRIHDLRHTYATIRLLRGHNIGDVSYQLGHSSIKITYDVYGHWIPGHFKNEVDELDDIRESLQIAAAGCV
jgi:integrase